MKNAMISLFLGWGTNRDDMGSKLMGMGGVEEFLEHRDIVTTSIGFKPVENSERRLVICDDDMILTLPKDKLRELYHEGQLQVEWIANLFDMTEEEFLKKVGIQ